MAEATDKPTETANGRRQTSEGDERSREASSVRSLFQRLHEVAPLGLGRDHEDVITRRPSRLTDREAEVEASWQPGSQTGTQAGRQIDG